MQQKKNKQFKQMSHALVGTNRGGHTIAADRSCARLSHALQGQHRVGGIEGLFGSMICIGGWRLTSRRHVLGINGRDANGSVQPLTRLGLYNLDASSDKACPVSVTPSC